MSSLKNGTSLRKAELAMTKEEIIECIAEAAFVLETRDFVLDRIYMAQIMREEQSQSPKEADDE